MDDRNSEVGAKKETVDSLRELGKETSNNKLVGEAGRLRFECSCEEGGLRGTLHAGDKGLVFTGTFFFFDKSVKLAWQDVRQIQEITQGIRILSNDDSITEFSAIQHPEKVWSILVSLHNDSLLDLPSATTPREETYRRRKSDPILASTNDILLEDAMEPASEPLVCHDSSRRGSNITELPSESASRSSELVEVEHSIGKLRLQPVHCIYNQMNGRLYAGNLGLAFYGKRFFFEAQILRLDFRTVKQFRVVSDEHSSGLGVTMLDGQMYTFHEVDSPDEVWASLVGLQNESLTMSPAARTRRGSQLRRTNSDPTLVSRSEDAGTDTGDIDHTEEKAVDVGQEWEVEKKKPAYSTVVVRNHRLEGCSLETFWDTFLAENAGSSFSRFLETRGDTDVTITDWKESDGGWKGRELNYMHPVNAPMAPPIAAARKEQSVRLFAEHGILLETKTFVKDVPMTDCFYVVDRMLVETMQGGVEVELQFELTFVKSTLFKGIITKTTTKEFINLFEAFSIFMTSAFQASLPETKGTVTEHDVCATPQTPEAGSPDHRNLLLFVLLACVILLQVWTILEIRGVKQSLGVLEALEERRCSTITAMDENFVKPT